ncbi:MAG: motility associated factor glycosyltransferase family protein [Myxococcota bacterium]
MSGIPHLIQTMQILEQLAEAADEMVQVQRNFEFERIKELVEKNTSLRPQLAAATAQLRDYQPQTEEERELLGLSTHLLKRIREGDRVFTIWRGNLEMMRALGSKMASQAVQNMASLAASPPWDLLRDRFQGVPAVVVAAGPSLDKNFHLIEQIKDKALIVTMNRCARVFQKAGIVPHLLLATDGSTILPDTHLAGVGTDILKNLLCRFSVHPKMQHIERERTFLFSDGSSHEHGLYERLGKATLPIGGGSVAHSCFQAAYHLGCDPIVIIGQDLAYSNDRIYSSSDIDSDARLLTTEDGKVAAITGGRLTDGGARGDGVSTGFKLRDIEGWDGSIVQTNRGFARHIEYFEALIDLNMSGRTIINATEGGANIRGMANIPFADAIAEHMTETQPDFFTTIREIHEAYEPDLNEAEVKAEVRKLSQAMTRLEKLARDCRKLVKSPRRDAKMVKRVKKNHVQLRAAYEEVEFLVRDVYFGIKSKRGVPSDQWALLEQEFDSIQKATKVLLPACREAVAGLGS